MDRIKCIVIDDEPIARQYLSDYVRKMPQLHMLTSFGKALDAYDLIESGEVDLVYLDIEMPGIKGIDFIQTLQKKPYIILTTAYSEYALQGYELDVVDYLLKPISFERFVKATNKVIRNVAILSRTKELIPPLEHDSGNSLARDFIFVKSGYKSVKVNIDDILYIESMKEYVLIHTGKKKYTKLDRMKNMESQLSDQGFIRIHRSYIVPVNKIHSVYGNMVEVSGDELPIGRSYKDTVYHVLGMGE